MICFRHMWLQFIPKSNVILTLCPVLYQTGKKLVCCLQKHVFCSICNPLWMSQTLFISDFSCLCCCFFLMVEFFMWIWIAKLIFYIHSSDKYFALMSLKQTKAWIMPAFWARFLFITKLFSCMDVAGYW